MVQGLVYRLTQLYHRSLGDETRHFANCMATVAIVWSVTSVLMSIVELPAEQARNAKLFNSRLAVTQTMANMSRCDPSQLEQSLDDLIDSYVDSSLCSKPRWKASTTGTCLVQCTSSLRPSR